MEGKNAWNFQSIVLFIVAIFTVVLQIFPTKTKESQITSMILFVAILIYVAFLYAIIWGTNKVKFYINMINSNTKEVLEIKRKMESEKKFNEIDKRVAILEHFYNRSYSLTKNKKGKIDIDPSWILIIILLILFYFYLRSRGILP